MRFQLSAAGLMLLANSLGGQGLPVTSDLVRRECGACHQVDSQQRMSRISYVRKTPEGWEETIQRMARLHGFRAAPADARKIEQYLSANHGLVASELARIAYSLDGEDVQEQVPNEAVKNACTTCHSYAKIAGQRRTREEWLNLKDFLLAMFPTLVYQHRFEDWVGLCDQALPWLAEQFPLDSPEWRREKDQKAPGEGRWLVTGHQLGKGDYVGSITFRAAADGELETEISRHFSGGGTSTTEGKGLWLGAFAWRGSGRSGDVNRQREIFHLSADGETQRGRWFPFEHPELGATEVRYRVDGSPQISGVLPKVLQRRATGVELRIYGANLGTSLGRGDIELGDGIIVDQVSEATSDHVVVQAHVAADAKVGKRNLRAGLASKADALALYDKADYILVLPEKSMARLGGVIAVKRFIQFEAHAFSDGPDGIPGNSDDLDLGMVKADWSIEDLSTSAGNQNAKYVGAIDQNGLFTPSQEGPNAERQRSTNNAGEVWVKASFTPRGSTAPLSARAYVLVSVPDYRELVTP
ncbi:MAG TPA: quinohemoprotein amine dehydrogenase subunit alpha [Bryobacteraceae bacterium]|nr:quinohemoprotein amine dehydrogenase subunit alpha [Bryobacteraceae bacterium]